MKYPAKALTAAALALVLAFTLLSTAVFAEEDPVFTITTDDRDSMLEQLQQKFTEQVNLQEDKFTVEIKGGVLEFYEIVGEGSEKELVLKSTGKPDPYLSSTLLYDEYSTVPANEYIYNVIVRGHIEPSALWPENITLAFTIEWDETKDQTDAVRNWAKEWVAENLKNVTDEFEKVKDIHDYIAENYSYDETLAVHTAYGMWTNGKGVCEAYALLARALLDEAGIESRLVFVDAKAKASDDKEPAPHMWNLVRIGGFWYHMDVT